MQYPDVLVMLSNSAFSMLDLLPSTHYGNGRVVWCNFCFSIAGSGGSAGWSAFIFFSVSFVVLVGFGGFWGFIGSLANALALAGHTVLEARHWEGVKRIRKVTPRGTQIGVWGSFAVH